MDTARLRAYCKPAESQAKAAARKQVSDHQTWHPAANTPRCRISIRPGTSKRLWAQRARQQGAGQGTKDEKWFLSLSPSPRGAQEHHQKFHAAAAEACGGSRAGQRPSDTFSCRAANRSLAPGWFHPQMVTVCQRKQQLLPPFPISTILS